MTQFEEITKSTTNMADWLFKTLSYKPHLIGVCCDICIYEKYSKECVCVHDCREGIKAFLESEVENE